MEFSIIALLIVLLSVNLHYVISAPNPNAEPNHHHFTNKELLQQFEAFLKDENQMASILGNIYEEETHERHKRDAEDISMNEGPQDEAPKDDGFFNRAARFVTELIQRFLRWINTDD